MPYDAGARPGGLLAASLAVILAMILAIVLATLGPAAAQDSGAPTIAPVGSPPTRPVEARPAPASPLKGVVKVLRSGPLLMHGNYCGIGNRPGAVPIDALDAACMRHDACTRTGKLPNCACNDRLRVEATAIARDPRAAPDELAAAAATASAMAVLICKAGGRLEVPILPAPR